MPDYTFPKLLKHNYEKYSDKKVAMLKKDRGIWQPYTWKECYEIVKNFSLGLLSMGLKPGDKVSIIGRSSPEWYWADIAVQAAGGIVVGIFNDCMPAEIKHYTLSSESKFIIAEDQEQVDKVLEIKEELPLIEKVIYWEPKGLWFYDQPYIISLDDVLSNGKEYEKTHLGLFEENIEKGVGDDTVLILYSSGTTGLPKGAMISNNNVLGISAALQAIHKWNDTDNYMSPIPPAWITGHVNIGMSFLAGCVTSFAESNETMQADLREVGPQTVMYAPPMWEQMVRMIQAKLTDTSGTKRFLYNIFLPIGYKKCDTEVARKELGFFWKALYRIADLVVYRNLKDKLGMLRVRDAYTGGMAVSPEIIRYYRAIGINMKMAYGLTEGGSNLVEIRDDDVKLETSGVPLDGIEVAVTEEGEILVRGIGLIKGYHKNPEATSRAIRGSWLHTGDFGHLDEDGHLTVMDRMADVKPLSTGKKFSPQYTETRLRFSPYVKDSLVFGNEKVEHIACLIDIDEVNAGHWAEAHNLPYTTYTDLSQKDEVIKLISSEIEKINRGLPEHAQVKKLVVMHKPFDPDELEVTRTGKLRRGAIEERFRDILDAVYEGKDTIRVQTPITYRDGRKGMLETTLKVQTLE